MLPTSLLHYSSCDTARTNGNTAKVRPGINPAAPLAGASVLVSSEAAEVAEAVASEVGVAVVSLVAFSYLSTTKSTTFLPYFSK